ncbi:ubiquitin carboxyl-terminal hydrolase 47-like [Hemitrygon akajei]|uniref:ubiquitin carboxyl-terminal hydrolase 47-like n=1 Tax=Hemitrygon akajei TaxID=2704970 RepID=UPI003BF9B9A4
MSPLRYYFKHLPQILTFQLKRFEFDYNYMAFQKITDCITFPLDLKFTRSQVNNAQNDSLVDVVKDNETPAQHQEVNRGDSVVFTGRNPETPQDHPQQVLTGQEEKTYELFAIWHHTGSCGSDHYYAEIKSNSGDWYNFNDEDVKKENDINLRCIE